MKRILIGTLCCFGLFASFVTGSAKAGPKVVGSGGHIDVKVWYLKITSFHKKFSSFTTRVDGPLEKLQ